MNTEKIRGIYPVLYAFFDENGGLDRDAMRRQVDFCVESGVHGVTVLGLGTEVYKLDLRERRLLLDWAAEDLGGRLPLAVTVSEPNVAAQIAFVRAAAEAGADWAILQPPPVRKSLPPERCGHTRMPRRTLCRGLRRETARPIRPDSERSEVRNLLVLYSFNAYHCLM